MSQLSLLGADEHPPEPTDRLFFAVMPDAATAARIAAQAEQLKRTLGLKGRLIEAERLHITLHHVGDHPGFPPGLVEQAQRAGAAMQAVPFEVAFERAESFAGRPRNRPFVLRGEGHGPLVGFQQALGLQMAKAGLSRWVDGRFTPHVTLAYDDLLVPATPIEPIGWRVDELVLVHSLLGRHRHAVLGRWRLAAAAA
jgi:2'-5' RNA ligase